MVEDVSGNLSDFVNEDEFKFIQEDFAEMNSFNIIDSPSMDETGNLDNMMINIINPNEETTCIEDFKYIDENCYFEPNAPKFPPEEPTELCNTDYSGPLGFEVFVDPSNLKNPWEYSPPLNKIFIDMKHKFPINFSVKTQPDHEELFIRIMPMFEEDRYFHELVFRCINHEQLDPINKDFPQHVAQHIIRCDNVNAQYYGDKNVGRRLNIVIPLSSPQAGTDSVKEFFQFVCKNSCVGGMNRRPIQVIFALEDVRGSVLGRRILYVRICSCPKRDREKEEKKREKSDNPTGKKRKIEKKVAPSTEAVDTKLFPFSINIVGEENYKRLAQYTYNLMAAEVVKLEGKPGADAPFRKCLNEVNNLLSKCSD